MGTQPHPQKRGHSPQFSANVYCGQTAEWIKMPRGTEVNLGPGDVVLDGVAHPPKGAQPPPPFSVHVYRGQTAGWMKRPLGMEVDLVPGHIVLDGDPVPPRKGHSSPLFSTHAYCGYGRPSQLLLSSCCIITYAKTSCRLCGCFPGSQEVVALHFAEMTNTQNRSVQV